MRERTVEIMVGLFIILGMMALIILAFKVSGLTTYSHASSYQLKASFDNVGALKVRAPVKIAGVKVGEVTKINLNKKTFQATVTLRVSSKDNNLPTDSSASILTSGLLGASYISLTPGFNTAVLKNDGTIETTHSAIILENLIGQLMFNLKSKN